VFLYIGLKAALTRPSAQGDAAPGLLQRSAQGTVGELLLFGAVAQVVNSDALIVLLPGVRIIATAGLGLAQAAAALVFLVAVLLLPAWLPVAATAAARKPALRLLSRLDDWLRAHERAVSAVTGVGIGAIFILRGWAGLRGAAQ
jgi:hypothetical protein